MTHVDVIVIGAGAAGMMCASLAGQRGRKVLVLDHANKVGKKILMSGGGRCNFTNMYTTHENFISENPHFCKSALSRYTPWDFIDLVNRHQIPYHEKKLGQLFCDNKANDIVEMLVAECQWAGAKIQTQTPVNSVKKVSDKFQVKTDTQTLSCDSLVIATGGLSIPTMGATGFGYDIARQFGLKVLPTRPALVPFTLTDPKQDKYKALSGISTEVRVSSENGMSFDEQMLFTHRGMSGPSMLQISSYWHKGESLSINLLASEDTDSFINEQLEQHPEQKLSTILSKVMPKQLAQTWLSDHLEDKPIKQLISRELTTLIQSLKNWQVKPADTEGYRTAEVTLGGIDTDGVSSKTMMAKEVPGLFFIGEVLDVTGHLGGHNFQWAWASAAAAAESV